MPETKIPNEIKEPKEMHTFVIVKPNGTEEGTFKGRQPRQAALKAINSVGGTKEKPTTIRLRQRGEKKIHIFQGYVEKVKSPEKRPAWMAEMVKKPFVTKLGIEKPPKKPKE